MQSFNLTKKIRLTILNLIFLSGFAFAEPVGEISESTGLGSILRNSEEVGNQVNTEIILKDEASTGNGRMKIVFLDEEVLDMTENTYAYIDEAYYDPNPDLSQMSIRVARGTARFTSGKGKKIKKANVNVGTPTAQITIKGTDFTTTVDEIGRTLVILLPDETGEQSSGEITVLNEGGEVTLTQAYEATMVSTWETPPTQSVTLNGVTPNIIDNMFIVNPPQEVQDRVAEEAQNDLDQDQGILDVDFLEFNELEQDALADTTEDLEFTELDIDMLDVDFLTDLLDVVEELERTTVVFGDAQKVSAGDFSLKGANIGFNKDSQFNVFVQDGDLYFYRNVNGTIEVIIAQGGSGFLDVGVEGYQGIIEFGDGNGIEIVIRQTN